jgi:branched-subunit amino acid transport protein
VKAVTQSDQTITFGTALPYLVANAVTTAMAAVTAKLTPLVQRTSPAASGIRGVNFFSAGIF